MTFCAQKIKMIKLHQTLYLLPPSSLRGEWGMGWWRDRVSCLKIHYLNLLAGKKARFIPFLQGTWISVFSQGSANAGSILLLTPARMNWGVKYDTNIMTLSLEELKQMLLSEEPIWQQFFFWGNFCIFSFPPSHYSSSMSPLETNYSSSHKPREHLWSYCGTSWILECSDSLPFTDNEMDHTALPLSNL